MPFECNISELGSARLIDVRGRVDSSNAIEFEHSLVPLFNGTSADSIMDLSSLDYISSAGLRVILIIAKRARVERARIILCGLSPNVREVFEISGFMKILDVAATRAEAQGRL